MTHVSGVSDSFERIPQSKGSLTAEERRAAKYAEDTLKLNDGRYEVGVPWKGQKPALSQDSNNRNVALVRLRSL